MMSPKVQDAFNEQMKQEYYSSYLYLSMSAYLDGANLPGLSKWMRAQAEFASPREVFDQAPVFLDWFVQEQVEEEKTSGLLAEQLRMVGDDRPGLLMLDRELGQRRSGVVEQPAHGG